MANVDDVANRILLRTGEVTTWKLQKLVYYAQAWHLVRFHTPLFDQPIEAWREGPVVRHLYDQHRTRNRVRHWAAGQASRLSPAESDLIDWVVTKYGGLSGDTLSQMTHAESPWFLTRGPLPRSAATDQPIDPALMRTFYARQEAPPGVAVAQAVANSALEGVQVGADWEQTLRDIAEGTVSADAAIDAEIAKLHGAG